MKTFAEWSADADWSVENLMLEAQGFKDVAVKRRKKKQEYLTPRQAKIKKLRTSSEWQGLR